MDYELQNMNERIDINGIYDIFNIMEYELIRNNHKYIYNIKEDDYYNDLYNKLVKKIIVNSKDINNQKYNKYNNYNNNQKGGSISAIALPGLMISTSSSIIISSVIGYIIYRILTRPKCRPKYSLIDHEPTIQEIIFLFIPKKYIQQVFPNVNLDISNDIIEYTKKTLEIFSSVLNIIAPSSTFGQIASSTVETVSGIALTALSTTTGAFTFGATIILNYLVKVFNMIKDAVGLMLRFVEALLSIFYLIDGESRKVLYDLLQINFNDGPYGVKCWVDYILTTYAKDTNFVKKICGILNSLLSAIYNRFISFISKALSFGIPDGGVVGILFSTLISLFKCKTYDAVLYLLNNTYNKISYDKQLLIEKPELMKKMLDTNINKTKSLFQKFGMNDRINKIISNITKNKNTNLYDLLINNTSMFAFIVNKVFAMVFAILQFLSHCSNRGFCSKLFNIEFSKSSSNNDNNNNNDDIVTVTTNKNDDN